MLQTRSFSTKFDIAPGKTVYVPTSAGRKRGKDICRSVLRRWRPNRVFFHLKRSGGHLTALRIHLGNSEFAARDLKGFYGSVTRTKIARSLRTIGFGHREALDIASDSVVVSEGRKFLPYGFVQSNLLATLALETSLLGKTLTSAASHSVRASVYVDDMIVSATTRGAIDNFMCVVDEAAAACGFEFNTEKSADSGAKIRSFNIDLSAAEMRIADGRMELLREKCATGNAAVIGGVIKYVSAVNRQQVADLAQTPVARFVGQSDD
jgi:hypothetical protein